MREHDWVDDQVKADNAAKNTTKEYAEGAIKCIELQLKYAQGQKRIAKLKLALRRWKLALDNHNGGKEGE